MTVDNRSFWVLIIVLIFGFFTLFTHGVVAFTAVNQNQERILKLEREKDVTLLKLAKDSQTTANQVVVALAQLTKVIGERSENDARILHLLETISDKLNGETNG